MYKFSSIIISFLFLVIVACTNKKTNEQGVEITAYVAPNWADVYHGILPCADCEGIQTEIELRGDTTFVYKTKYMSTKDSTIHENRGAFTWSADGKTIKLSGEGAADQFAINGNELVKLDMDGNRITGDLAPLYVLKRASLTGRYWKLVALYGKPVTTSENSKEPYLMLKEEGNVATGNAGCNGFTGTYALTGDNQIKFSKMAATMMACVQMESEAQFLHILEDVDNYAFKGNQLFLRKAEMTPLAQFEAVNFK